MLWISTGFWGLIILYSRALWRTVGQSHALLGLSRKAWDAFWSYRPFSAIIYVRLPDISDRSSLNEAVWSLVKYSCTPTEKLRPINPSQNRADRIFLSLLGNSSPTVREACINNPASSNYLRVSEAWLGLSISLNLAGRGNNIPHPISFASSASYL